jgi:hypothetical protein
MRLSTVESPLSHKDSDTTDGKINKNKRKRKEEEEQVRRAAFKGA